MYSVTQAVSIYPKEKENDLESYCFYAIYISYLLPNVLGFNAESSSEWSIEFKAKVQTTSITFVCMITL